MTSHLLRIVQLLAVLLLVAPSEGYSESNPVETLKTCVLERLPIERGKAKPKYESVKKACAEEYDALFAVVHPKVANAYKKLIREDIEKELKK